MNSPIGAMGLGKESIWNGTDKNSEVTAETIAMFDGSVDRIFPASRVASIPTGRGGLPVELMRRSTLCRCVVQLPTGFGSIYVQRPQ